MNKEKGENLCGYCRKWKLPCQYLEARKALEIMPTKNVKSAFENNKHFFQEVNCPNLLEVDTLRVVESPKHEPGN